MPGYTPEKKYEVSYRSRTGNVTTKTASATGTSDRDVRSQFESATIQVLSVIYKGLSGKSVRAG